MKDFCTKRRNERVVDDVKEKEVSWRETEQKNPTRKEPSYEKKIF